MKRWGIEEVEEECQPEEKGAERGVARVEERGVFWK